MKKMIAVLCAVILISQIPKTEALAFSRTYPNINIQQFLQNNNSEAIVDEVVSLFGDNGSVVAFLYVLKPTGYIIVDSTKGYVVEFSLENECPFEKVEEGKLYYGGPMKYLVEHEGGYINCKSGMIVCSDEFEEMADSFTTKSE